MGLSDLTPARIAYQKAHIKDNIGPAIIAVTITLSTLSIVSVALRFFARWKKRIPWQWDDWLCVPSLALVICLSVELVLAVQLGIGKHFITLSLLNIWRLLQISFYLSITYSLVHWTIKMSILLSYIRLFTLHSTWMRVVTFITMVYTTGWAVSMIIVILFQCRPIHFYWDRYNLTKPDLQGVCPLNPTLFPLVASALNTAGDIAVLAIPIFALNNLRLKRKKKIALISVFCMGGFACIASIVRLSYITQEAEVSADMPWIMGIVYLCTSIEASVGLMSACFPTFWPLLKGHIDIKSTKKYNYSSSRESHLHNRKQVGDDQLEFSKNTSDSIPYESKELQPSLKSFTSCSNAV